MAEFTQRITTIYVTYGEVSGGGALEGFFWKSGSSSTWSKPPVEISEETMLLKHSSCGVKIYYKFGDVVGELPLSDGPVVTPGRHDNVEFSVGLNEGAFKPGQTSIGIVKINPGSHENLTSVPGTNRMPGHTIGAGHAITENPQLDTRGPAIDLDPKHRMPKP